MAQTAKQSNNYGVGPAHIHSYLKFKGGPSLRWLLILVNLGILSVLGIMGLGACPEFE